MIHCATRFKALTLTVTPALVSDAPSPCYIAYWCVCRASSLMSSKSQRYRHNITTAQCYGSTAAATSISVSRTSCASCTAH
eukprot:17669-Heterococcus_DN1.PRE.3